MSFSSAFGCGGVRSAVRTASLCLVIVTLLIPFTARAAADDQPPRTMPIQATVTVDWNVESGSTRNEGKMTMRMQGTARLAEGVSVMDPAAMGTIISYSAQGVNVNFSYDERIYQEHPPTGCPALMAEYQGNGNFTLKEINTAMTSGLNIRKMGSLIPKEMLQFAPPEAKEMMIDYYDFFALAEKQTVSGKKRGYNDCNFQPDSKDVSPAQLSIRFRITDEGEMKGRRKWSVDGNSGSPSFHMLVSDLPEKIERRPLVPEPDGGSGINYAVDWHFGEVDPYVEIQRREGGQWVPIVEEPVEVKVGEKLELRGVVMPEGKDTGRGRWTVPGRPVQEFVVQGDSGYVDWLEGRELDTQELTFHWWDGEEGLEVHYKTTSSDGKSLDGSAAFNVAEPDTMLRAYLDSGQFQIVEVNYTDPDGTPHQGNELVLGAGNGQTIRFCHDPLPGDFQPGSTQFVQYVHTRGRVESDKEKMTGACIQIENEGLDGSYPYAPGPETRDSPGVPVSFYDFSISVTYDFTTQLMYKPDIEGAIFVPLSEMDWYWSGNCSRGGLNDNWTMGDCQAHAPATGTPAESWMEWNSVTTGTETWDVCN